jgi:hypothetical protein
MLRLLFGVETFNKSIWYQANQFTSQLFLYPTGNNMDAAMQDDGKTNYFSVMLGNSYVP